MRAAATNTVCQNVKACFGRKSVAEVYAEVCFAEVCGNAEMHTVSYWNHSRNNFAEVYAEVCGSGVAKSLISLDAEVSSLLHSSRRRASPAPLRFAALTYDVDHSGPNSYVENVDPMGMLCLGAAARSACDTSRAPIFGDAP